LQGTTSFGFAANYIPYPKQNSPQTQRRNSWRQVGTSNISGKIACQYYRADDSMVVSLLHFF
jgi:hypothetical protein